LGSKAIRIIGYVEVTWTSGTGWATTPSYVQMFGPGIKKPGDSVQTVFTSGTSLSITPTSVVNLISVDTGGYLLVDATTGAIWQVDVTLKRGSTSLILGGSCNYYASSGNSAECSFGFPYLDAPATTSPTTYSLTAGGGAGAGVSVYTIRASEVMGALDEPANDNGSDELRMVG
jgi:hypothetical protein